MVRTTPYHLDMFDGPVIEACPHPPPLVRPGEKKVRSERGGCLRHRRALDKEGGRFHPEGGLLPGRLRRLLQCVWGLLQGTDKPPLDGRKACKAMDGWAHPSQALKDAPLSEDHKNQIYMNTYRHIYCIHTYIYIHRLGDPVLQVSFILA